jgi:predicted permease
MLVPTFHEFRFAARRLRAAPLFTFFAVASLAIGVGVTTVAYAVVDGLLGVRVGVRDADNAIVIATARSGRQVPARMSRSDFQHLRERQRSFSSFSASLSRSVAVAGAERTVLVVAEAVDGTYFQTVGASVSLGRAIQPADEDARAPVAVLGDGLWREHFAADPSVVGRAIRVDGRLVDVIGVAAPSYSGVATGPARRTALWMPLDALPPGDATGPAAAGPGPAVDGEAGRLSVIGRLRSGIDIDAAAADVAAIAGELDRTAPLRSDDAGAPDQPRGWTAVTLPGVLPQVGDGRRLELVLAALVTLVLIVACTNLANLVLARGTLRQQDVAVRRALGAGDWRLVREQLAESLIITAGGALAAVAVMRLAVVLAARDLQLFPGFTLVIRPQIDGRTIVFAALALLVSLVVFGVEPAIRLARCADVRGPLAAMAARMGRLGRYRVLLRWQIAASTAFFVIAVVAVRYIVADAAHDPGVRLDGLVVAEVSIPSAWNDGRVRSTTERIASDPEIRSLAIASGLPFGSSAGEVRLSAADPRAGAGASHRALHIASTAALFRELGIPILRGRTFDDRASSSREPVAVINERGARLLFGTTDAVGRSVFVSTGNRNDSDVRSATVVGVARDTDTRVYMRAERDPMVYTPLDAAPGPSIAIVARGPDEAGALAALHAAVRRADPDLAVLRSGPGWDVLGGPFTVVRFLGSSALALGALTLLLAMAGLYGIQSQNVSLRTREIGVRLSFGASAVRIYRMVLADSYRPVSEGLIMGLVAGVAARAIARIYLDVPLSVLDPWMLALVPVPLVLAAFCAGYLPARRASRVDPGVALRDL